MPLPDYIAPAPQPQAKPARGRREASSAPAASYPSLPTAGAGAASARGTGDASGLLARINASAAERADVQIAQAAAEKQTTAVPDWYSKQQDTADQLVLGAAHDVQLQQDPTLGPREVQAEEAKARYAEQAPRRARLEALGGEVQGPKVPGRVQDLGVGDVSRMSWDEYQALDERQRAAVDFNTMLVRAVKKDLHHQADYAPTDQEKASYNMALDRMFGDDNTGSELATYAPETVSVLKQIGFNDDKADLDDFLGLKAAITAHDIKHLDDKLNQFPGKEAPNATALIQGSQDASVTSPGEERLQLSQSLADSTAYMQDAITKGNNLLQSIQQTAAVARNNTVEELGGIANHPKPMTGYGDPQFDATGAPTNIDAYFQQGFNLLADKSGNIDTKGVLADMSSVLTPDEFNAFMDYANNRTAQSDRFDVALGTQEGVQYRNPTQLRKLLGFDEGE